MNDLQNQAYLLNSQYKNATNLNARIYLHEHFSTNPGNWQQWVFEQMNVIPDSFILEIGTGPGQLWYQNQHRIPADCHITLTDFSSGMLQEAQQNLASSNAHFTFQQADVQDLPFNDRSFDVAIANHMLYHVPDRLQAFTEIRRVLKAGGHFYATTTGHKHLQEIDRMQQEVGISLTGTFTPSTFTLENGAEQLAPHFSSIGMRRWNDNLLVTDAAALLAFIVASAREGSISQEQYQRLQANIEDEIARNGAIHIAKDSGIFIAM
jgi:ubiquinone/menaquinone biosynthesis C-methylase UbiE